MLGHMYRNIFCGVNNGCSFLECYMTIVKADYIWPVDYMWPIFVKIIKFQVKEMR